MNKLKPEGYLEKQLKFFLNKVEKKTWLFLKNFIFVKNGVIFIKNNNIFLDIKKQNFIKKKPLQNIFGKYLGFYAIRLQDILEGSTPILIANKRADILGALPLVIDKIKSKDIGASIFAKKWVTNMEDASFGIQKRLVKEIKIFNSKPENKEELKELYKQILLKNKSKKEGAKFLEKELYLKPSRAALWADDLAGNYYAESTEKIYKESNIKKYTWITSGDKRVRPKHQIYNGTIRTVGVGIAPQEEYRCRCYAEPYFGDEKIGTRIKTIRGKEKVVASTEQVRNELNKLKKK